MRFYDVILRASPLSSSRLKSPNMMSEPQQGKSEIEMALAQLPTDLTADQIKSQAMVICREFLIKARAQARVDLKTAGSGITCAQSISNAHDAVLRALYELTTSRLYPAENRSSGERVAVCATGGYGRGTMAPGSDIDILFLFAFKQSAWTESVAEAMLYFLWDLGLKVGHATRSVDECIREAAGDLTIKTALLETRLITGDLGLYHDLVGRFDREIVKGNGADFAHDKLEEREIRLKKQGSSRYLVEPNVKEGKGGLRDLNTLFWILKFVYRVQETSEMVKEGVFTPAELALFQRCEDFLWRVRSMMHFVAGRAEERLSFDMQRQVAEEFKYRASGGLSPVERFMKHYFLVAKDVGDLTAIVCAALEAREQKPRAMLDRMLSSLKRRRRVLSGTKDFIIDHDRITVADDDTFSKDPVNLLRIFWYAAQNQLELHPDAKRLVTLSLRSIDAKLRKDPEANRLFLEILTARSVSEIVLRRMHETGVLGRFIPEFGRIQSMMQFSSYHHYTVDEHTLRAVGVLGTIDAGGLKEEHPVANEIFPTIQSRRALYVAMFLHDIGKGRDEDHSILGARIARDLCPRLGLTEAETETVSWLVEQHLLMSNISQHRDISDPKTITDFVASVQTLERLKLLLVLTICDIKAVGPGVWNGWKGQLLRALYWEAEIIIAGGHSALNRKERVQASQEELRKALPEFSDQEFASYASRHFPAYWLKVDLARKRKHAALLKQASESNEMLLTKTETDRFRGVTELTVLAIDHPRLLAIITGACAAAGANIVEAQIFTTTDGLALDSIFISRAFERDEDELRRAERVAKHIIQTLKGEIKLPDEVASRASSRPNVAGFVIAPEVLIDNSLSDRNSVIEITGLDRHGLLYELTSVIGRLNLNINSARIVTFGEKAVDVFYVTDLTGGKIIKPGKQNELKQQLLAVFSDQHKQAKA
jgi:[protein-PII] uridylyltransferase